MAIINKAGVTIPEVMEDLIQYEYENNLVLGKFAYVDNTLVGAPGDTVTVPYCAPLSDAEDVQEGSALTPEANADSKITITVKKTGKAVKMTQEAINSCAYDLKSQRRSEIGKAIARKVDKDLAAEMAKTTLVHNATSAITYQEVVDARALMGEEAFSTAPIMIMNSKEYAKFAKTPEFIAVATQIEGFGVNAAGVLVDMPVIVSDRVADKEAYIFVPGAFALVNKQFPTLYGDVDALTEETLMSSFVHYGTDLPNKSRGVVKIVVGN